MMEKTGCLFLSDFEWQRGKTAASISFVRNAEQYIINCDNKDEIKRLRKAILKIKEGKLELFKYLTPKEFIDKYKPKTN
ncbi:MAG: hypothetical protein AAB461_00635 [Patescibacteria group bacterium]